MRNYVFVRNPDAFNIIEEHLAGLRVCTVEISENRKGKVIKFADSYWVHRLRDHIEEERNSIAFDLAVVAMSEQEKESTTKLVNSLDRIAGELAKISHEFRIRGDYQTT